jgi:hypothetical protein
MIIPPVRIWRLRMTAFGSDFTEAGWNANELGIWYGASNADELSRANSLDDLASLPAQRELKWDLSTRLYHTAIRFRNISESDWVLVYLRHQRSLGLAKLATPLQSDDHHKFNREGEIFKFRRITEKKLFSIDALPDAYQLLPAQGRANVYELKSMKQHVEALAKYDSSDDLVAHLKSLSLPELLDFLGASAWESFCMAYLIAEEGFLPTGLSPGKTLAVLDLVGRRQSDGSRIYAQCKKSGSDIDKDFLVLAEVAQNCILYFFAFDGLADLLPNVCVFTKRDALNWAATDSGSRYVSLLL